MFVIDPVFLMVFGLGVLSCLAVIGLWRFLLILLDFRASRRTASDDFVSQPSNDPRHTEALKKVQDCKRRLLLQKTPNPELLKPLVEEVPKLVHEIAKVYYPDHAEPIWAPGVSQFMRATHLAATDIADFLQNNRVGRLVDISAETARKGVEITQKLSKDKWVQRLIYSYRKLRPLYQLMRYNSPLTYIHLVVSNIAIRTFQRVTINIVAKRVIQLYSGQLTAEEKQSPDVAA